MYDHKNCDYISDAISEMIMTFDIIIAGCYTVLCAESVKNFIEGGALRKILKEFKIKV